MADIDTSKEAIEDMIADLRNNPLILKYTPFQVGATLEALKHIKEAAEAAVFDFFNSQDADKSMRQLFELLRTDKVNAPKQGEAE